MTLGTHQTMAALDPKATLVPAADLSGVEAQADIAGQEPRSAASRPSRSFEHASRSLRSGHPDEGARDRLGGCATVWLLDQRRNRQALRIRLGLVDHELTNIGYDFAMLKAIASAAVVANQHGSRA
jgi:hypothetical protein